MLSDWDGCLPCCLCHLFVTSCCGGITQRCLGKEVVGGGDHGFTCQGERRSCLPFRESRLALLRTCECGDLRYGEGSLKDEYGVVNRQIGMQRLERSVGVELAAWPFAPTEVSSADQNGSGSRGRNETHAAPLRVCGGECV